MQSFEARRAVEAGEGRGQREGGVKAVRELHGKISGMVGVEVEMEGVKGWSGASRKGQNDEDEEARPAKILRDE